MGPNFGSKNVFHNIFLLPINIFYSILQPEMAVNFWIDSDKAYNDKSWYGSKRNNTDLIALDHQNGLSSKHPIGSIVAECNDINEKRFLSYPYD